MSCLHPARRGSNGGRWSQAPFLSADLGGQKRSPTPWCFSPLATAATSLGPSCSSTEASRKFEPTEMNRVSTPKETKNANSSDQRSTVEHTRPQAVERRCCGGGRGDRQADHDRIRGKGRRRNDGVKGL